MTYEVIGDSAVRAKWLELRRQGIGGSDAPALLGLVPWASPASVQAEKWGLLDEPEEAEVLAWGRRLETAIIRGLSHDLGETIEHDGRLLQSTEHPWMLCTPDGWNDDRKCWVQVKNTVKAEDWQERIPEAVWVQCQHEMAVTGAAEEQVAALVLGNRLRWAMVKRDEAFIREVLIPAEREFWTLTENHEPARPDASEHTKRAYQALWPEDTGETVPLSGEYVALDEERLRLLKEKKAAETRLREIDNAFREALKGATYGALPNGVTYSLKTQHRKAHEVKASSFRMLRRAKESKR